MVLAVLLKTEKKGEMYQKYKILFPKTNFRIKLLNLDKFYVLFFALKSYSCNGMIAVNNEQITFNIEFFISSYLEITKTE